MSNQVVKPLSILSIGEKTGDNLLTNQQLQAAGAAVDCNSSIVARKSSLVSVLIKDGALDVAYLAEWVNQSTKQKILASPSCTTTLGSGAVKDAISKLTIQVDQLGLLIGDTITSAEVTPSEGQRIAGSLGLKIPCYDITAASGAFVVQLDALRRWKTDRVPEYTCLVSANTASHFINSSMPFGSNFSDGASALILSNQISGRLIIEDTYISKDPVRLNSMAVQKFGSVHFDQTAFTEDVRKGFTDSLNILKSKEGQQALNDGYFIGSQCLSAVTNQLAVEFGFNPSRILQIGDSDGDCVGAVPGIILSRHMSRLETGRKVFVVQSGIGFSGGYVVLRISS